MKKLVLGLFCGSLVMSTTACGTTPMMAQGPAPAQLAAANAGLRANASLPRQAKTETPIVNRKVNVTLTPFDNVAEQNLRKQFPADPAFAKNNSRARGPFDSPFGELPYRTYSDFEDDVRYGYDTPYEDYKYMSQRYARNHFNRYINGAFRDVQELYKASRTDMKRFIKLDVLVNSISVSGRPLPYQDIHNPPAERHYKLLPTEAARVMPTFGEIMSYNRNSYDVNYERWDTYRAARYYQANYKRIFGLVMEYGPTKKEAYKMVHREITSYAGR